LKIIIYLFCQNLLIINKYIGLEVGNALELTNIYASVQNYDEDEKGLKEVETLGGTIPNITRDL